MSNKIAKYIGFKVIRLILATRYKVTYTGRDRLTKENLSKEGGVLFLPNHTAEVDPLIVGTGVWFEFEPRPLIVEWIGEVPIVGSIMKLMRAIPIPNFTKRSSQLKRFRADEAFDEVVQGLKLGDNFLVYPAGKLKSTEKESIGGASGTFKILQQNPDINIVLVRTLGLWGSTFSKGWDGKPVVFMTAVLNAIKAVLMNGFFFLPKRKVSVEYLPVNDIFPRNASKVEVNRFLEGWYNQVPDPLNLVPYHFWSKKVLRHFNPSSKDTEVKGVPKEIQEELKEEIARIAKITPEQVYPEQLLSSDLRLDSLDMQDLVTFLEEQYNVKRINPYQLTTVASIMNYAASPEEPSTEEIKLASSSESWKEFAKDSSIRASIYGSNIPEAFFRISYQRKKDIACADLISKEVTHEKLMLSVILLSKKIEKLPGKYIGILMPASVAVNVLVIACQVAKKIPVMINWTVGRHHLEAVKKTTNLESIITSKAFLKNLPDLDLTIVLDQLVFVEDLRASISLYEKLKAAFLTKLKYETLIKKLGLLQIDKKSPAVLLFTSGTETTPKGVPLSHENILFDMKSAFDRVKTTNQDVILGFLPPFHSYGFTVCGLLPLVSGVRAIYYPNPTHYKKLARLIEQWGVTFLAGAPTFLKGILQPSQKELYKSLRVIISGAEKAPESLLKKIEEICPDADFLEGYGLSECAPILTLNIPGQVHQGVGPALDGVEILITHPETGKPVPQGEKGQVLGRGPNIFEGYLGEGIQSPFVECEGKKWFKTGDLGYLDERGYLTLVGRLKRQIKIGGEMINLNALEDGLTKKFIDEGMIDLEHKDEPSLAVCANEESDRPRIYLFTTFDVQVDEVNKRIRKLGFSNLHKVYHVQKIDALPLMGSGKVHYRKLEDIFKKSA